MKSLKYYLFKSAYKTYSSARGTSRFPYQFNIELTNLCNLRCIGCPYGKMTRPKGNMDFELFKKIVDETKGHNVLSVRLHLFGEPLIHPEIDKFIKYIKQNSDVKDVNLSTNCVLLNEEISKRLIDSGLDTIRLCLDGISAETYEKIRINSDFEKVVGNIQRFLEIRNSSNAKGPKVELQIIHMQNTKEEIEQFKSRWMPLLKKEDVLHVQKYVNFGGQVEDRTVTKRPWLTKVPCLRLWNTIAIAWNGTVTACCYDSDNKLKIGDVKEKSIEEIWNDKPINSLREAHLSGNSSRLPLCSGCIRHTP